nr:unnamed protein product [Digitaria exilis]
MGADQGVGDDADLRPVAILERIDAAWEDWRRWKLTPCGVPNVVEIEDEETGHEVHPGHNGGAPRERIELVAMRDQDGMHHGVGEPRGADLRGGFGVVDGGLIHAEAYDAGSVPRPHRREGHSAAAVEQAAGGGTRGDLEDGVGGLLHSMLHHQQPPEARKRPSSSSLSERE